MVGREFEGAEEWRGEDIREHSFVGPCVDVYLSAVHLARSAALQTVVAMSALGLPRDVSRLIARCVANAFLGGSCRLSAVVVLLSPSLSICTFTLSKARIQHTQFELV